jgi:hypothetical protein
MRDRGLRTKGALIIAAVSLLWATTCLAGDVEYRTGGTAFARTWQRFYVEADHEPELDDPLIEAGRPMVAAICEAVAHPDMKRRRYAIGALGYIRDRAALPTLEAILGSASELEYFRGDALQSIYRIDRKLGTKYAVQLEKQGGYLQMVATAVRKRERWLLRPSKE